MTIRKAYGVCAVCEREDGNTDPKELFVWDGNPDNPDPEPLCLVHAAPVADCPPEFIDEWLALGLPTAYELAGPPEQVEYLEWEALRVWEQLPEYRETEA